MFKIGKRHELNQSNIKTYNVNTLAVTQNSRQASRLLPGCYL